MTLETCYYCGLLCCRPVSDWRWLLPSTATTDHMLPTCRGGSDDPHNLVTACWRCNSQKGSKTPEEYRHWLEAKTGMTVVFAGEAGAMWEQGSYIGAVQPYFLKSPWLPD